MKIKVEEIRKGDHFVGPDGYHHWTATSDPEERQAGSTPIVIVEVVFRDGGGDYRVWDAGTEIEIERPDGLDSLRALLP